MSSAKLLLIGAALVALASCHAAVFGDSWQTDESNSPDGIASHNWPKVDHWQFVRDDRVATAVKLLADTSVLEIPLADAQSLSQVDLVLGADDRVFLLRALRGSVGGLEVRNRPGAFQDISLITIVGNCLDPDRMIRDPVLVVRKVRPRVIMAESCGL